MGCSGSSLCPGTLLNNLSEMAPRICRSEKVIIILRLRNYNSGPPTLLVTSHLLWEGFKSPGWNTVPAPAPPPPLHTHTHTLYTDFPLPSVIPEKPWCQPTQKRCVYINCCCQYCDRTFKTRVKDLPVKLLPVNIVTVILRLEPKF